MTGSPVRLSMEQNRKLDTDIISKLDKKKITDIYKQ
jgi:hypothetical protein